MQIIVLYLIIINLIALTLFALDKRKAQTHAWRIPERTLFGVAIIGGSVGSILGMQMFRHKTKHLSFVIGMPVILLLQIVVVIYCWHTGLLLL